MARFSMDACPCLRKSETALVTAIFSLSAQIGKLTRAKELGESLTLNRNTDAGRLQRDPKDNTRSKTRRNVKNTPAESKRCIQIRGTVLPNGCASPCSVVPTVNSAAPRSCVPSRDFAEARLPKELGRETIPYSLGNFGTADRLR